MPQAPPPPKLKLLCLHGYAQNGQFFRERTGAVRKQLKSVCEFTFLDAPRPATGEFLGQIDEATRGAPLGWYNTRDGNRPALSSSYDGLEESLALVRTTCQSQGPFDGVLGFSQGATLAALLCLTTDLFQFAVLFAGYVPRDSTVLASMDAGAPCTLPSFHCLGATDASVPPDVARALASRFADPVIHEHEGGHVVPGNAPLRSALKAFLVARRNAAAVAPTGAAPADTPVESAEPPTAALEALQVTQDAVPPPPPPPPPPGGWGDIPVLADEEEAFAAEFGISQSEYDAMPSWQRAELLQKILRPSTMIGRRVNLPMRAGGGIGVIRDVQANLCFVDREISEEDEGWEGLEPRVTCNRDELSYVDEDAPE